MVILLMGWGDEILQDRRYRYFFFYLNRFNTKLNPTSPTYNTDYKIQLVNSHNLIREILTKHDLWGISTTTKLTTAMGLSIKDNIEYFRSTQFENELFNPQNIATFMNFFRTKPDYTSKTAAEKREKVFGMDIKKIHGDLANTRDQRTSINRRASYDARKKSNNEI